MARAPPLYFAPRRIAVASLRACCFSFDKEFFCKNISQFANVLLLPHLPNHQALSTFLQMAPTSLEAGTGKRQISRDRSLNSRLTQVPPSQQPPDFLTDSLNASYIPSPSPKKGDTRPGIRAKPRRVLGTPRSLAASFKASAGKSIEYRPPSSASSSDHQSTNPTLNSHVAQVNAHGYIISPGKSPEKVSPVHPRTPSPVRGRQISIVSPSSSASSPPRGLAEAYQRINDEELLAQEDSVDNDMGSYSYQYPITGSSREVNEARLQRMHNSVSPISLRSTRRASPKRSGDDLTSTEDQIKTNEAKADESDDESVLSNLDNPTENSGSSSQFTKDLHRVNGVLKKDAKAFRKARLGSRVGLTVENLKRRNDSFESLGSAPEGSISSKGSDPSINIPREWGRKARTGKDWLNRINDKNGNFTGDESKVQTTPEGVHLESAMTGATKGGDDQAQSFNRRVEMGAEVSEATEKGGMAGQSAPSHSSPSSTTPKRNVSHERGADWEINDDDFTGRSLQISDSPPIRVRKNAVDRLLEQEIDSLAKRAVTTNRLGELREKTSEERLRRRFHNKSAEDISQDETDTSRKVSQQRRSTAKFPLKPITEAKTSHSDIVLVDEGDPIPDSPIVVYRSSSDIARKGTESNIVEDHGGSSSRGSSHDSRDSRDLLRKLSRATSESPKPAREEQVQQDVDDDAIVIDILSQPKASKAAQETESEKSKQPTKGEVNSDFERNLDIEAEKKCSQETPKQSRTNSTLKTPLVTGAWIDTPLPTGGGGLHSPTPADLEDEKDITLETKEDARKVSADDLIRKSNPNIRSTHPQLLNQEPLKNTGPLIPKSALESVILAAKLNSKSKLPTSKDSANVNSDSEEDIPLYIGESTIQSLEEILDDTDYSKSAVPSPPSSSSETPVDHDPAITKPLTPAEESRLSDIQSYAHQISRLGNVGPSIRDAKRRLASLERILSVTQPASTSKSLKTQDRCDEAGEFHDFIWPCERCGCPARRDLAFAQHATNNLATISISVPSLWWWHKDDWRPRLTWLGVIALVWALWWILDWIAW